MILTAHQPVYLPWLGLFHKIALADVFVSFDTVQYLARDWNNRNRIQTVHGTSWLTVPVLSKGYRSKSIRQIEINNALPWRRKHWRSIELAYQSAPYFELYAPSLQRVYSRDWSSLCNLNEYMLQWFLEALSIQPKLVRASDHVFHGSKSDLILNMCLQLHADIYIFGTLGRDYAEVEKFEAAGVRVLFQSYEHPVYVQQSGTFISHLSVIDLLFNHGPHSREILMSGNLSREQIERAEPVSSEAGRA